MPKIKAGTSRPLIISEERSVTAGNRGLNTLGSWSGLGMLMKDEDRHCGGGNKEQAQASGRAGFLVQYSMTYYHSDGDKKQLAKRCATCRLRPVCCLCPVYSKGLRALHQESPLDLRLNTFELLFPFDISWLDLSSNLGSARSLKILENCMHCRVRVAFWHLLYEAANSEPQDRAWHTHLN